MDIFRILLFAFGLMIVSASSAHAESLTCPRIVYDGVEANAHVEVKDSIPYVATSLADPTDTYCIVDSRGIRRFAEKGLLYGSLPYRFEYDYFTTAVFGDKAKNEFLKRSEQPSVSCSKAIEKCTIYPVSETHAYSFEIKIVDGGMAAVMIFDANQFMRDSGQGVASGDQADETKPLILTIVKDKKSTPLEWAETNTIAYGLGTRWEGKSAKSILGIIKNKTVFQLSFKSEQGKIYGFQTDAAHSLASLEVALVWLTAMAKEDEK